MAGGFLVHLKKRSSDIGKTNKQDMSSHLGISGIFKRFAMYQGSLLHGSIFSFTALVRNLAMNADGKAFKAVIVICLQTQSAPA